MIRSETRASQRGLTLLELLLSISIGVVTLGGASALTQTTTEMSRASHVDSRAHVEHRRGLLAVSDVLRTVALGTLQGFDAGGASSQPAFQRVLGVDAHEPLYGAIERLEWRRSNRPVAGVKDPGAVWLVTGKQARIIADRVPGGGFVVRQEGNVLAIRLTTYYATDQRHSAWVTSETAVSLRN